MERLARFGLALAALAFAGFGVAFLGWPVEMARSVDVTVASDVGVVELRAMYGGCQLALAVFLGGCLRRREMVPAGLLLAALALGGLGFGRLLSGMATGALRGPHPVLLAMELGGGLAAALLWSRVRPARGR